jgi:RimJ/RimL family protein N-acetyltransferase
VPAYLLKTDLKNGVHVYIRFLKPQDKDWIKAGYEELSFRTQYLRFISPPRSLSDKDLKYLTEIDNKEHVALVAFTRKKSLKIPLGVARYIKTSDNQDSAEFAITVTDSFQNQGLGTILFNLIVKHAGKNNISNLTGYVLSENYAMLKILKHRKINIKKEEGTLLRIDIPINR